MMKTFLFFALILCIPSLHAAEPEPSRTGSYEMKLGKRWGQLDVLDSGTGQLRFDLLSNLILNAKTGGVNIGTTCGEAKLEKGKAEYRNPSQDCLLKFSFSAKGVEIVQEGACDYGMGVSAAGSYTKISSKTPKMDLCR